MPSSSIEPGFQRRLTAFFVFGYFCLIFTFIGLCVALYMVDQPIYAKDTREAMVWLQGILSLLIGVLTGSVKDQLQYHFGSSVGSKAKDEARAQSISAGR